MNRHAGIRAALIALCIILILLSGCGRQTEQTVEVLNVYATFYPLYACAQMIMENVPYVNLFCLTAPQDGCLRDYQLSDWDRALLQRSADLIIAGGRGLERFEGELYDMGDAGPAVACVLYNMEFADNPGTMHIDVDSESHFLDPNPHIYMCIDGMLSIAESICAQMCVVDPANTRLYQHNLERTKNRLDSLSSEMHAYTGDLTGRNVILMNEALTYTANEYHLNVAYCVDRDSGEAFHDAELAKCISELEPYRGSVILIEKQAPSAFVDALTEAGFTVARMDIMSTRSAKRGETGYFDAQRMNAQNLASVFQINQETEP